MSPTGLITTGVSGPKASIDWTCTCASCKQRRESMAATNVGAASADREIVLTRVFDAPPELVFQAWTESVHIAQWWGPTGFRTTIYEMDVRPGGVWRFVMHGPDGRDYKNRIIFHEIVKNERLTYTHMGEDEDPNVFEVVVTF